MIIKGKDIKPETITMWLNVLSLIVGFIFYIRLEQRSKHELDVLPTQPIRDPPRNPLGDDWRLIRPEY